MASLLDVLLILPIQENVVSFLTLGDLFNLSKTNSENHDVLHRLRIFPNKERSRDTFHCRGLKAKTLWECSEPHHVRGAGVQSCRICSMPVCEACVIKMSFGRQNEGTFATRCRSLCSDCYGSGNTVGNTLSKSVDAPQSLADDLHLYCTCAAKDGHLCLKCKNKQKHESQFDIDKCHGSGCSRTGLTGFPSRVCLWCGLRVLGKSNRASARRDYNSRHLLARAHSTYERRSDEDIIECVMLESLGVPRTAKGEPFAFDPFERRRQQELDEVSTRRSLTGHAAEDARWARSEALRRPDTKLSMFPSVRRRTASLNGQNSSWRDSDSTAPTLIDDGFEDESIPPVDNSPPERNKAIALPKSSLLEFHEPCYKQQ